ncbi:MAG: DUF3021 domain-containing protein [Solibacillus sp.]
MKWIQNIILGCLISLSASYITITVITLNKSPKLWSGEELLEQILLTLILGVVIGTATLLFEIESWSYLRILILHFLIVLVSVFTVGALGGWYDIENPATIFFLVCEIIVIYIVVSFITIVLRTIEIKKLNEVLKKKTEE